MGFMTALRGLFNPFNPSRLTALARRWQTYPTNWQTHDQAIGRYVVGCGATHGVHERCNFGCTACYLGSTANQQKPMPFDQVRDQLAHLRDYLGPGGNVQITSGEVTLLPADDLIRIVRTARDMELSPMVMTHGDVFLHQPEYLRRLIVEGGLRKLSFHVDITQRGRKGFAKPSSETELNQVRNSMAELLTKMRRETGVRIKAATTLTANRENLDQLGPVMDWFLDHLDQFRILSIQPQAKTGRTHDDRGVSAEEVWKRLESAIGMPLSDHPFKFGHDACNRFSLFLGLRTRRRTFCLQAIRPQHPEDRRLAARFLQDAPGLVLADRPALQIVSGLLGFLIRKPQWLWHGFFYGLRRSWQERRHWPAVASALLTFSLTIRPFAFIVHAFMDRDMLDTPEGRERLEACVFKCSVDGQLVSMCELNGSGMRETTYQV